MNILTPEWLLNELSRSFINPLLGIDLRDGNFNRPKTTGWFVEQDFIPRQETGSAAVVQGVRAGENPELTTMWTLLGYPPVSVTVPVWVKGADKKLPQLVLPDAAGKNPMALGKKVLTLTKNVFSYNQGAGTSRYLNWELLYNNNKTGYMQRLAPVEKRVFDITRPTLDAARRNGKLNVEEVYKCYDELDQHVAEAYRTMFGL